MMYCYILIMLSSLLFFHSFFPVTKTARKFENEPPTHIYNTSLKRDVIYASDIDKIILIVIDALRLDFVNYQYMPLTSKITKQRGCFNKIKVEVPTVTLPRIKALISGNVPQFIDLVLNLASTEILEDSLIHSAYNKGKRIVFYGDDTWLKLFPNYFSRFEGTNSFFVRDFKEVDDNVTRNVNYELNRDDWDIMILHYLGLDHIGHIYGPHSSLVPTKLQEMDEIIHEIYLKTSLKVGNTLLIVTGDHGMRDSGGHGGATYFETHVPLLKIGHECVNDSFPQTDVPVNLAVLLGLNIPSVSIGQIRPNILSLDLEKLLFVLRYNTLILMQKSKICTDQFELASTFHEIFLKNGDKVLGLKSITLYKNCCEIISEELIRSSVDQDVFSLIVAILVMFNLLLILINELVLFHCNLSDNYFRYQYLLFLIMLFLKMFTISNFFLLFVFILMIILIYNMLTLFKNLKWNIIFDNTTFLILFSIVHPLTFVSSSFVEEEHQYWYYFNNIFLLINMTYFLKTHRSTNAVYCLTLLVALRFLRTLNSTGDKWANYPDTSDWLINSENYCYYQLFYIISLITLLFSLHQFKIIKHFQDNLSCFAILPFIYVFKNTDYNNILLGKLIWFTIFLNYIFIWRTSKIVTWILICVLLLKPYNIILISFCIFTCKFYIKEFKNITLITLSCSWLGNLLYFAQGHSNSLASVDVSVGYIGLGEYQPLFVITQVLCHSYAFPILCHFFILENRSIKENVAWMILFCNRLYVTIATSVITFMFRHHLFIWSVFAPKLFIEIVHTTFLFVEYALYYLCNKVYLFLVNVKNK